MIHEEICTYEVCKLAKEKGFPQNDGGVNIGYYAWDGLRKIHSLVNAFAIYNPEYNPENLFAAPTQSLLQRWLREEKRIEVNAFWDNADNMWLGYAQEMDTPDLVGSFPLNKPFPTYELALEDALKYVLENLV